MVQLRLLLQGRDKLRLMVTSVTFRCSDGVDRHRQEWLDYGCPEQVRLARVSCYRPVVL